MVDVEDRREAMVPRVGVGWGGGGGRQLNRDLPLIQSSQVGLATRSVVVEIIAPR